jgi:hypothetical protein
MRLGDDDIRGDGDEADAEEEATSPQVGTSTKSSIYPLKTDINQQKQKLMNTNSHNYSY